MGVFSELKRRSVFRVAAAYVVVSWLVLQVAALLEPALRLPEWFDTFAAVILLIGFPIALVLSWAFELTAEGVKRAVPGAAPASTGTLDWVLVIALVVLIGFLGYREFGGRSQPATAATAAPTDLVTIVVLPFSDISPSGDQGFLAQGVSVELAKILVKVQGLSILQLKGRTFDPATLGGRIESSYVLDGNVQKAGDTVQITAQLMSARDGVLAWADNYQQDFDVENLFDIQNEIALAIAKAVAIPLKLAPGQMLSGAPTANTEAFELYLRARAAYRQRNVVAADDMLVAVVAMEPDFAQAWALLAQIHSTYPAFVPRFDSYSVDADLSLIKRSMAILKHAASRAYALDPEDVDVLTALAGSQRDHDTFAVAEDTYLRALGKDPNHPELLEDYSQFLRIVGRLEEALDVAKRLVKIEPSEPQYHTLLGAGLHMTGNHDDAIALLESGVVDPNFNFVTTAHRLLSYFELGRYEDARQALRGYRPGMVTAEQFENMDQILLALAAGNEPPPVDTSDSAVLINLLWPKLGASQAYLRFWRRVLVEGGWKDVAMNLAYPSVSPARKTDGYKEMVTELGLVDYWRERGWPKYCQPVGEDDFECE